MTSRDVIICGLNTQLSVSVRSYVRDCLAKHWNVESLLEFDRQSDRSNLLFCGLTKFARSIELQQYLWLKSHCIFVKLAQQLGGIFGFGKVVRTDTNHQFIVSTDSYHKMVNNRTVHGRDDMQLHGFEAKRLIVVNFETCALNFTNPHIAETLRWKTVVLNLFDDAAMAAQEQRKLLSGREMFASGQHAIDFGASGMRIPTGWIL